MCSADMSTYMVTACTTISSFASNTGNDPYVFGLSSITWTAISAIAQGLAAFGSVALLVVTLLSRRDADRALEQARRLASGTAALVEVTQRAQALAVKPAIEVRRDISNRQVIIVNRGNGPLLEPRICVGNEECTFRVRDEATSEYREVGGL